jgi:molybdate transport system substrate-binding protein
MVPAADHRVTHLHRRLRGGVAVAMLALAGCGPATAATVRVAVAANFQPVLAELAPRFAAAGEHDLLVSAGPTGKLSAQVEQGAPFDVLLAADAERPRQLVARGHAVRGSRFTYARGRLVLWSARQGWQLGPPALRAGDFAHLAIANPESAPYGAAALEVLLALDLHQPLARKLVRGESVGQTFAFVDSGAAELGFLALSQVVDRAGGSRWLVPATLHSPIEQQAVLLTRAGEPEAARAFLRWLGEREAREVIRRFGYELP